MASRVITSLPPQPWTNGSISTADIGLFSSAWGSTASVEAVGGTDTAGWARILCGGTGIVSGPRIVLTYKGGDFPVVPVAVAACADDQASPSTTSFAVASIVAVATLQMCIVGTPTSGRRYTFSWVVVGLPGA